MDALADVCKDKETAIIAVSERVGLRGNPRQSCREDFFRFSGDHEPEDGKGGRQGCADGLRRSGDHQGVLMKMFLTALGFLTLYHTTGALRQTGRPLAARWRISHCGAFYSVGACRLQRLLSAHEREARQHSDDNLALRYYGRPSGQTASWTPWTASPAAEPKRTCLG